MKEFSSQEKSPFAITVFLLIQAFSVLLATRIINFYSQEVTLSEIMFTAVGVSNFIIAITAVYWLSNSHSLNTKVDFQKETLNTLNETLKIIRSERHDFINHLMAIHGLILAGEHKSVNNYIKQINQDYHFVNQILNVNNSYLRVLIQNKKYTAEALGINFKFVVKSKLKGFDMDPKSITAIFGNLFDNAIDAVKDSRGEKQITFEINELKFQYLFVISDSGERISPEVLEKMFMAGFSTKGDDRGYGMELVKKSLSNYKGQITYDDRNGKQFNVLIPKPSRDF